MTFFGHVLLFFAAGFSWQLMNVDRGNRFGVFLLIALPIAGVYFLGWWAVLTFIVGAIFGGMALRTHTTHQAAWNALMGAYTFRHLDAAQQQRVLDRVRVILGGQFNRTIEDVLNDSGRIVFLNFLVYGLGEEGIHPSLGKESWFWIKNPFVECIGAEEVLEKQIQQIEKKHSVTLDLNFREGA